MIKKHIFLSVLVILIITVAAPAQEFAPVGTAVAQFLEIGVGARGTAIGDAYTTLPSDAGAVFWNPAGLTNVTRRNVFTAYNRWPADISIGGVALAMNFGHLGTVALSTLYLMTGDMDITTVYQPEGTGETFSITNFAAGLSYARTLTDRLSFGLTAKVVREKYMEHGYTSWALDIGTLYRTGFRGMTLGMSIMHFGPEIRFDGQFIDYSDPRSVDRNQSKTFETYSLPMNFRVGLSLNLLDRAVHKVIVAADMIHSNNNLEQYNSGVEYSFNQMFFLRGGYKFNLDEGGLTLGAGVNFDPMCLSYSFANLGILKDVHRVSLALSF